VAGTDVGRMLAFLEAIAEIMNVPPGQITAILAKAKKNMGGR